MGEVSTAKRYSLRYFLLGGGILEIAFGILLVAVGVNELLTPKPSPDIGFADYMYAMAQIAGIASVSLGLGLVTAGAGLVYWRRHPYILQVLPILMIIYFWYELGISL